jgi:hypothetical protein
MSGFPNNQSNPAGAIPVWITTPVGDISLSSTGSGDEPIPAFVGDSYTSTVLSSASGTSPVTLQTGAPGYYVTRLQVSFDPTCTLAVAGMVTVTFTDSVAGVIGQARAWIPAAFVAPTVPVQMLLAQSGAGYFFRSKSATSTLSVALSVALTAGSIRVAINGGTTSIDS